MTRRIGLIGVVVVALLHAACSDLKTPKPEPYYAETSPPRKQEFRWSNGKLPKSLDPARAAAPPETDLVRAIFEGLTEIDPRTLNARPAVAERWEPSEDFRTWKFFLRDDARWSNGKPVTAGDFVRSWTRLAEFGTAGAHRDLLKNFANLPARRKPSAESRSSETANAATNSMPANLANAANQNSDRSLSNSNSKSIGPQTETGIVAIDDHTLQITLVAPDKDLPKLVAHPIFRPVPDDADSVFQSGLTPSIVTNGAFRIVAADPTSVKLDRSEIYWNRDAVKLEHVRFVAAETAEQALEAYKAGEVDVVTNAEFEPLALKLLEPFEDFRRRTHAAVNFYEINHEKAPFDDRRVRGALAISIERERLTEGEMEGLTQPALSFLSFTGTPDAKLVQDKDRARSLLEEAGYPGGKDFPPIRLVVNRNDVQQRVARTVARMWKQNLNIDTEVVVKENAELESARDAGDYDLIRRNAVFPTADELMCILSILKPPQHSAEQTTQRPGEPAVEARDPANAVEPDPGAEAKLESPDVTMSEANAVYELWAIPLYFPTSYSLVKPYVTGFEMNSLDSPSLADVSIDSDWQPK